MSIKLFITKREDTNWYRIFNVEKELEKIKNKKIFFFDDLTFLYEDDFNNKYDLGDLIYYILIYKYEILN